VTLSTGISANYRTNAALFMIDQRSGESALTIQRQAASLLQRRLKRIEVGRTMGRSRGRTGAMDRPPRVVKAREMPEVRT